MALIRVSGRAAAVPASPVRSILVSLQHEGVPIQTLCGGRAMCGKCAVRILDGAQLLSPVRARELGRLAEMGAPEGVRLACQTFPRGDVFVQILNPRPSPDPSRPGEP